MAAKTILKNGSIRVKIRKKNLKPISRTFSLASEANDYQFRIESEINSIEESQRATLPVDMAAFYRSLHPDLQQAVQLLPIFTRVLGDISGNELTLSKLIDHYMFQYEKKDQNVISRLSWWSDNYGQLKLNELTEDHVRHGINTLLTIGSTGKKGISQQTTNRFKANLSSVFEYGKEKFNLKTNPCRYIKAKPEGKGRKRYLSTVEQLRFLEAAKLSSWERSIYWC
jgi:hypothetical protein